jgi:ABC transport system ATP-binding/permease protein
MISYLQTLNVSKRIGDRLIFGNINFNVNRDDKLAIVGVNGSGKSSLLDIMAGLQSPDEGGVTFARDLRISYLRQEPSLDESNTIADELFSSGTVITNLIRDYEKSLHTGNEKLIQIMVQQMDDIKAWDYEVTVKQVLHKLKLYDLNATISTLSGGERKRVALAKVLVEESDLLILDEPTNHLDIEMVEWLEDYLSDSVRSIVMVTHDRYFLDRICNGIYELSDGSIFRYDGNYSYFLEKRQERDTAARTSAEKAKNIFRTELEWMRRMPKARRHKSKSRIEDFNSLKESIRMPSEVKSISINVDSTRMGKKILYLHNISKAFNSGDLIKNFSFKFTRFEKVGLVGPNGSGKTTLLNIITGSVRPDSGSVEAGETVKFGYYRQEGIAFDDEMTALDAAKKISEEVTLGNGNTVPVSSFMNHFLFPPDRQRTQIKKLSGGEKRRLYLMTVLMQNPNFLLLDEPTNDLDILTLNVLEEYLAGFKGCVLISSHDRYFLDKIVDHIFEYRGGGELKDFPGNYSQLRDYRSGIAAKSEKQGGIKRKSPGDQKKQGAETAIKKGLSWKEKREIELLESEISELELEKQKLESEMSEGNISPADLNEKSKRFGDLMKIIEIKELRWMELCDK